MTNYSGSLEIRATLTPARPPLAIRQAGTNVVISWHTNYTCWTLYSTTNLTLPTTWTLVSPAPTSVLGYNTVTNPINGYRRFYRLQ